MRDGNRVRTDGAPGRRRSRGDARAPAPSPQSEDCLYLNVATPAADDGGPPGARVDPRWWLPTGAGSIPWYHGTRLAAADDVVVVADQLPPRRPRLLAPAGARRGATPARATRASSTRSPPSSGCRQHRRLRRRPRQRHDLRRVRRRDERRHPARHAGRRRPLPPGHRPVGRVPGSVDRRAGGETTAAVLAALGGVVAGSAARRAGRRAARRPGRRSRRGACSGRRRRRRACFPSSRSSTASCSPSIRSTRSPRAPRPTSTSSTGTDAEEFTLFTVAPRARVRSTRPACSGSSPAPRAPTTRRRHRRAVPRRCTGGDTGRAARAPSPPTASSGFPAEELLDAQSAHADTYALSVLVPSRPAFDGRLGACHALDIPFVFDVVDRPGIGVLRRRADQRCDRARRLDARGVDGVRPRRVAGGRRSAVVAAWDPETREIMDLDVEPEVVALRPGRG